MLRSGKWCRFWAISTAQTDHLMRNQGSKAAKTINLPRMQILRLLSSPIIYCH